MKTEWLGDLLSADAPVARAYLKKDKVALMKKGETFASGDYGIRDLMKKLLRYGTEFYDVDFSGLELKDINFAEAELSGSNFSGATLIRTDMPWISFRYGEMNNAILNDVSMNKADLEGPFSMGRPLMTCQ